MATTTTPRPEQAWVELVELDLEADQRGETLPKLPFQRIPYKNMSAVAYYEPDDLDRVPSRTRLAPIKTFVFPFTVATCVHPVRFAVPEGMPDDMAARLVGLRMGVPEKCLPWP